jgi:hypothetical protein
MPTWYRIAIESDDPEQAEARATSLEHALTAALRAAPCSPTVEAYQDSLPQRRGRIFWLSQDAFQLVAELARLHGAQPYPGLVDMRFLSPL